jgi:hypothetical protein
MTWRIGQHYNIHVYETTEDEDDDRPVATFHNPDDARLAVDAVNWLLDPRHDDQGRP